LENVSKWHLPQFEILERAFMSSFNMWKTTFLYIILVITPLHFSLACYESEVELRLPIQAFKLEESD